MTIFAMENELRNLKGRGHFPIPKITPHGIRIDNPQQAKKTLEVVDDKLVQILKGLRETETKYEKEKEEVRLREQQARANKPVQRHENNYLRPNSSTPIKNTDTVAGIQNCQTEGVHFNPNTVQHYYNMTGTTSHTSRYEPPANHSIIQAATTAPPWTTDNQPDHWNRSKRSLEKQWCEHTNPQQFATLRCCIIGWVSNETNEDVHTYTCRIYSSRDLDTLLHKVEVKSIGRILVYIHSQQRIEKCENCS